MGVSSSMSSRLEKSFGISLTRRIISKPMTDGKISAVDGESFSAQSDARQRHCIAVNRPTAARPRITCHRAQAAADRHMEAENRRAEDRAPGGDGKR